MLDILNKCSLVMYECLKVSGKNKCLTWTQILGRLVYRVKILISTFSVESVLALSRTYPAGKIKTQFVLEIITDTGEDRFKNSVLPLIKECIVLNLYRSFYSVYSSTNKLATIAITGNSLEGGSLTNKKHSRVS